MGYASSRELRPGRIRFPDISPRAYEHPADKGAHSRSLSLSKGV